MVKQACAARGISQSKLIFHRALIPRSHACGSDRMPYLKWIKALSASFEDLEALVHWMEVGTELLQWPLLSRDPDHREERWYRTKVTLLEPMENAKPPLFSITSTKALKCQLQSSSGPGLKLYIVEDLSQQVIETLGHRFQIDPHLFSQHLDIFALSRSWDSWGKTARLHYSHSRRVQYLSSPHCRCDQSWSILTHHLS